MTNNKRAQPLSKIASEADKRASSIVSPTTVAIKRLYKKFGRLGIFSPAAHDYGRMKQKRSAEKRASTIAEKA